MKNKQPLVVLFIILCALNQHVYADLKEELNNLDELRKNLKQERIIRINEKVDNYNQLKSLEMKIYSLEDKLTELRIKRNDMKKELDVLKERRNELQEGYDKIHKNAEDMREFLTSGLKELQQRIEEGFPYKKDKRLEKVNLLIEKMEINELTMEEGIDEFFRMLAEELVSAQKCELYSGEIEGRETKCLKIGGIFSVYMSTAGEIGFLRKSLRKGELTHKWRRDIKSALKRKLRTLFRLIEKRKDKYLNFPFDVTQGVKTRKETGRTGIIGWLVKGGPVMIPIAAVALCILIMALERLFTLRNEYIDSDTLFRKVMELRHNKKKEDAINLCETTTGPVARMLREGLVNSQKGKEVVEEAIHEATLHELPGLEKYLSAIGVLAAVAPLLGLLGTVSGMINTFRVITYYGGADPRLLAGGISEALITTQAGLIIAVPALLLHSYLSNKVNRIATDMEKNAVRFINSLED